MSSLSRDQLQQLQSYSIYVDDSANTVFNLQQLHNDEFLPDFLTLIKAISKVESDTIALSYFTRRYGMFVAMQFYMLTMYDEVWDGSFGNLKFGVKEEFGNKALCMFTHSLDWQMIDEDERETTFKKILEQQCNAIFSQLRKITSVSPKMLWENVFGYMLWHLHVLLSNPGTCEQAQIDIALLEDNSLWSSFAKHSYFKEYTGGDHPSKLINIPVRKTCCFSKDVPGWMQCGFCPLK
ncbi:Fe-S oxidoreductase [Rummeliibacillus pycnus]|uniref:Fe-S oxidoreductase n=1 Tax=Rummeliibacillus pycnus TaxID=101070 RepID=UPI0037C82375